MRALRRIVLALLPTLSAAPGEAAPPGGALDPIRRLAIVSAFAPEAERLIAQTRETRTHTVNGIAFTTGTLAGKDVVLVLSGVSMVNAAMTSQLLLDRFDVEAIVVSGIAGGVDPALKIGDVVVPARWGQYLEAVFARETESNRFTMPSWAESPFAPFGMIHPQPVEVRSDRVPDGEERFWFEADPRMLETARATIAEVDLERCLPDQTCLPSPPSLVVGGNGVSGQAFVDNAAFRDYAFETFEANVLDMETAAIATVAHANSVPFIAFRSLSDLAGGGPGENEMATFLKLAADNSAAVVLSFLAAWSPAP